MFDFDHWREIYHALAANKVRTLLTAFGVFWGIFMLVVMLGSGTGLRNGVNEEFVGSATNSFFVWTQRTSKPYRGLPAGRRFSINNADVPALRRAVDEVDVISPRNQLGGYRGGNNVTRGTKAGAFNIMGDYPQFLEIQAVNLVRGRFLNVRDIDERRKIAVIGTGVQDVLFEEGEDPIGGHVTVNGVPFKVVGLFKPLRSGDDGDSDAQNIHVPFTTFQKAFNYGDRVGWLAVTAREGVLASVAEQRVLSVLKGRHRVDPEDDRAFGHWNSEVEFKRMNGLFAGIQILTWIVGTGTLAAGVIGVSNIMLVIVRERTHELGIRRAIGATPFAVQAQIVLEALILTSIAGYCGLVAGVAVLELTALALSGFEVSMFKNPGVSLATALQALAILVVAGVFAGLMPAHRAVSMSPVEALRIDT